MDDVARTLPSHPRPALPRRAVLGVAGVLAVGSARGQGAWPRTVTDVLGRRVTIKAPPRAVLLGEGFQLLNLALVHPDPVSILVGTGGELKRVDAAMDTALRRRFPALERVPELTASVGQGFPAERALALRPDLVVLSAWQANSQEMRRAVELLEGSGVPVVYVDFFQRPARNTVPGLRLLGAALGQEERAEGITAFIEERKARIAGGVAARGGEGPRVLFAAYAGRWPCCWAPGPEGSVGEFLVALRARNVAAGVVPGGGGSIPVESVLLSGAEVFIGTGTAVQGETAGLQLGGGVSPEAARASLEVVMRAPELAALPAARARRAFGLWHAFTQSAINIVAEEAMARWVRPEIFGALDPAATLAEINGRFSAFPYEGSFWTGLG
ncbi:ABC transporter substrate-binding protein [Pararoseomonas indoligenes]|uniref:ABC transporter substrate-binding protein n=1 Tax=Roseomonas indoligenes TaxID=2820811 RepID=A0A940MYE9_9PROT|nr:ABC transporter substrate-binding protein [Pararoseomonas indoligenes]MBP0493335.1 ABC transporter substrate-binding protein [Pararoseomonas indoligenes]